MKKKLFVFLVASSCSFPTLIQAQSSENNLKTSGIDIEPERFKWEVGVDMLALLKISDPMGNAKYMYVRKYSEGKIKKTALEFALGVSFLNTTSTRSFSNKIPPAGLNSHDYSIRFGKEYQFQNGKFMIFHGPFIGFNYRVSSGRGNDALTISNEFVNTDFGGSIGYKIGVRYFINSRFSLSSSGSFLGVYRNSDSVKKVFDSSTGLTETINLTNADVLTYDLYPIATFQLGYHF
jgi:hypothetical protein